MRYSKAKYGRVFVIRLEDGEIIHEEIERFVKEHSIRAAALIILGGADRESKLVVGPEEGRASPVVPMDYVLNNVYEVTGTGTVFPDVNGNPVLHMHIACGREAETITGCVRRGVKVWHIMEVVLTELVDCSAVRILEPELGFSLLRP